MSTIEDKPKSATRTRIVAWSLYPGATAIFFLSGTFLSMNQLAYHFGQGFVYLLFLAIVLALIGRNKTPEFKASLTLVGAILWAGFLFFVAIHLSNKQLELSSAKEEFRELAQTQRQVLIAQEGRFNKPVADTSWPSVQAGPPESPATTLQTPNQTDRAAISLSEYVRAANVILKDVSSRMLDATAKIDADLEKVSLETFLLPQALLTSDGIDQNRDKIREYSDLLERYRAVSRATVTEIDERMSALNAGQPDEADFLRAYAHGKKIRADLVAKIYANHEASIVSMTKVNDFMAARLGRVTLQSDQLIFPTQEESDTYNSFLGEIQHQVEVDTQLQKMDQDMTRKSLTELEGLVN